MKKVVTFGEILLRLSTQSFLRFSQAESYKATYGGGEFNVAVSLANYGLDAEFITRLPDNELGHSAIKEMRKLHVKSENIVLGGDRLGLYFLETGASTRASNVIYDRANSAMATIQKGTINWREIFKDADWFHWSGITPALSESAAEACLEAIEMAHELGLTISTDLNYRSKLWQYGKQPHEVMPKMLQYSNLILGDIDTAYFMLGIEKANPDYQDEASLPKLYDKIFELCPNLKTAATTLRYSVSASHQRIGGVLYDRQKIYNAAVQEVTPVVDRVGSGDAFMGGLIYGFSEELFDKQRALNFAVAACCLKHTIEGDYNLVTKEEVEKLLSGDFSGKVSR
ncbi:2-dehydro-3-deoxygluconokinase [Flavobacterium noncentrifugens]|uniref:2-dehydro-3-deoxygluconokinase n=1 Tax=Flavobacterium noncentrifugens TaxID=1128970 RepID=A0A1G8Y9A5_9FLAO|nr:sugar kinase [Flavobacterium noncentrifugens]GEP51141.1 2-dehydro-3-deoxygluconokinase [Flavobacterium noncentrifugens]SDJ99469.1 2-dehydro-3-deoxygluconokinase [Flavobacterium noncentrifugens]